jgi:hypothetical protein
MNGWWWDGLTKSGDLDGNYISPTRIPEFWDKFDELKDAVTLIKNYNFQKSNNGGRVVWKGN